MSPSSKQIILYLLDAGRGMSKGFGTEVRIKSSGQQSRQTLHCIHIENMYDIMTSADDASITPEREVAGRELSSRPATTAQWGTQKKVQRKPERKKTASRRRSYGELSFWKEMIMWDLSRGETR